MNWNKKFNIDFFKNARNLQIIIGALLLLLITETIILVQKDKKEYEVNLVAINHEPDSINAFQLKDDLSKMDHFVKSVRSFLHAKNIKHESLEQLVSDSLSSSVYLAKRSNRYSSFLANLEEKLSIVPLGLPTTQGYISSPYGERVNPIPPKKTVYKNKDVKPNTSETEQKKPETNAANVTPNKPPEKIVVTKENRDSIAKLRAARQKAKEEEALAAKQQDNSKNKIGTKGATLDEEEDAELMQFHKGIDIAMAYGSPVKCTAAGTVIAAGTQSGYGLCVIVRHSNGLATLYAHLSDILVKVGEDVNVGEEIAKSGNSGRSTGPHLHYEVRRDGTPVNPKLFLGF